MLNFRNFATIFAIVFIFAFLIGCATHKPIKQPDLNLNMEAQQNKQIAGKVGK
jgi:hypothetical protein